MDARIYMVPALCLAQSALCLSTTTCWLTSGAFEKQVNGPTALATDNKGHLFIVEQDENRILRLDLRRERIVTVAGNGKKCCYKEGARATEVSLDFLRALAVDSHGNVFLAENSQLKKIDGRTALISIVAGKTESGETVEGAAARSAQFSDIAALAVDADGGLFVAVNRGKVFRIDPDTGTVRLYAGNGKFGYAGDGGLAVDASFRFPSGLAFDNAGNLIVADYENCAIRRIERETSVIRTVAVTGGAEQNCAAHPSNSRPGAFPSDPGTDLDGNVYYVEGAMDFVMRVDARTSAISVLAGNGKRGFAGDYGPARRAELANPSGLAVDLAGNIFISDYLNNRIRRVDARTKIITTVAGNGSPMRAISTQ